MTDSTAPNHLLVIEETTDDDWFHVAVVTDSHFVTAVGMKANKRDLVL